MTTRLMTAPRWVIGLLTGTLFGTFMAIFNRINDPDGSIIGVVIGGAVGGALFGLIMGRYLSSMNQRAIDATGPVPPGDLPAVLRASSRGPIPSDPALRQAAWRVGTYRLSQMERHPLRNRAIFLLLAAGYAIGAIFSSPWWLLGSLVFIGILAMNEIQRHRLEVRLDELVHPAGETDPTDAHGVGSDNRTRD